MITTSHHRQSTSQDDAYNTLTGLLYYLCNQIARKKLCLSGYQHKNKELHTRNSKTQNRPTGVGGGKQEVQLSQRDRAMLCVTEYFAKSLKIILFNCIFQFYWTNKWWWWWWWWWNEILEKDVSPHNYLVVTMYLVPFLRHSALNNGDTSKSGFGLFYRIPISNLIYQG